MLSGFEKICDVRWNAVGDVCVRYLHASGNVNVTETCVRNPHASVNVNAVGDVCAQPPSECECECDNPGSRTVRARCWNQRQGGFKFREHLHERSIKREVVYHRIEGN
jgi:hypothetical protein